LRDLIALLGNGGMHGVSVALPAHTKQD
jgi:hypothetical protein